MSDVAVPRTDKPPQWGIVVIGRNEGARLVTGLTSAIAAAGRDAVVYVDSGSRDRSVEIARQLGLEVVELDPAEPFTAARGRNAGFERLRALKPGLDFVQFLDGDCELAPGWVDRALDFLIAHTRVAVVCGRRRERHPKRSLYNRLCDEEWDTPVGEALACGGDAMVRAAAFEQAGFYRAQLVAGEEPELCLRLREKGWTIQRLDAEMAVHDAAMTRFGQWWRRMARGGRGFAEVSALHRDSPARIWQRETMRAIFWAGVLPMGVLAGAAVSKAALLALLLYPAQACRIAFRRGAARAWSWVYAAFMLLAKFAELQGIALYYLSRLGPKAAPRARFEPRDLHGRNSV